MSSSTCLIMSEIKGQEDVETGFFSKFNPPVAKNVSDKNKKMLVLASSHSFQSSEERFIGKKIDLPELLSTIFDI